ncbi:MAG: 1-(5-phosphoribosyl)-5-[(5-phosphoribosylamino)methylideneamino]imidazole-4-carboxamide isomerase [Acidobacteriota bacterium]
MVELIPAIDLRAGRCVRLTQGRREHEVRYSEDPPEQARHWVGAGARRLHVVDLDGAFAGRLVQRETITSVVRAAGVPVQLGGGLRSEADLEAAFAAGVDRAILGTAAIENPALLAGALSRWGERIAVAVDVRDGQPVSRGWEKVVALTLGELLQRLRDAGVERVICTDVSRDGMLEGPNLILTAQVARLFGGRVMASGGFGKLGDLARARRLELLGLEGVVIGKALYEGRFELGEAIRALSGPPAEAAPGPGTTSAGGSR